MSAARDRATQRPAPSAAARQRHRAGSEPEAPPVAGIVAAALTAAALLTAVVVRLALAGKRAAGWLPVPRRPRPPPTAVWILAHNARASRACSGCSWSPSSPRAPPAPPGRSWARGPAGEVVIAGAIAGNVLVIGAAIGGYGTRMLVAMLPHGPVELAAYSLALGLYLADAAEPLPQPDMAVVACASVALLALAAALETWVSL